MPSMDDFRLVVPMRARFRDTDAMGHVNNAIYFTYFEEARAAYFQHVTDLRSYNDVAIILAHTRCDYRSPLYTGEEFDVGVRVDRIGAKSFDMSYRAVERTESRLLAEGMSVQVAFDYATRSSVAVPESFRSRVLAFEGRPLDGAR